MNQSQVAKTIKSKFRKDPLLVYNTLWGDSIVHWDKFDEITRAVWENQRVVVQSGHGTGKTYNAAHLVIAFMFAFSPAKVITTAPTWYQVEKLLWSEIKKAYNISRIPLGGRMLETQFKLNEDWFALGLSPKEDASTREFGIQRLQGFHAENMLIVLDEAPAISHGVFTAIESLIVSPNNKILAIGNPTSPSGPFYDACRSPLWKKIVVSCYDHPNVKGDEIVIPGAVTREWIESRKTEWGEDSPLWKSKVLGEFPDESDDTLIPLSWCEAAVNNDNVLSGDRRLSVDVARFGSDKTALADFDGERCTTIETYAKRDTVFTVGQIMRRRKLANYSTIIVDDTGVGGGVTDQLEDMGVNVTAFIAAGEPRDKTMFKNIRSEAYWVLREAFKPSSKGKQHISIPDDPELINQLTSIKFKYSRSGHIEIESKDDMKKRGLKSPDKADALAMGNYYQGDFVEDDVGMTIVDL